MNRGVAALIAISLAVGARAACAQSDELPRAMMIERSTAPAPLAQHATLTVSPLKRRGDRFVGNYQIVIAPIGLASENGTLEVTLPADALRRSNEHKPIAFKGGATSDAGKARTIEGVATPADDHHGAVQLRIHSERGTLKFNTSYRLP